MSAFGGMVLTNRGRNLQAKAQSGAQLNFTRFGVGDGELGGSSILELNALKHQVKSVNISKAKAVTGGKATIGMVLSNQDLVTGFYFREIGLFAQDPDVGEILYCYANAGATADYIPAGGGTDVVEKSFDVIAIVGTAANVTATIEESLIFETPEGAQARVDALAGEGNTTTVKAIDDDLKEHKADYVRQPGYAVATGSVNTYTAILNPAPTAYIDGMAISIKINVTNTEASTININGLGAKPIKKANGNDVTSGSLKASSIYTLRYNGANFILQGEGASGNATASDLLSGKTAETDAGPIVGAMVDHSTSNAEAVGFNTGDSGGKKYIWLIPPKGYWDGIRKVWVNDDDFIPANFANGKQVLDMVGTHPNHYEGTTQPTNDIGVDGDYYIVKGV